VSATTLQLALTVAAGILFSALFTFAWAGPTSAPRAAPAPAPLNVCGTFGPNCRLLRRQNTYILDNFANVDEVKESVTKILVGEVVYGPWSSCLASIL
jgi:hypothetical protein